MPKIDDNKNQFTVRIDSKRQQINEFIERYEAETGEKLELQKDVFYALLESATSEKNTNNANFDNLQSEFNKISNELEKYKEFLSDSEKRVIEQNQTIETLQNLCDKQSSFEAELLKTQSELSADAELQKNKANEFEKKISILETKFDLNLSALQKSVAKKHIKSNKDALRAINKLNADGKFDGIFDAVDDSMSDENIANLIKSVFMVSAVKKLALNSVFDKNEFEMACNKYLKDNE